MEYTELEDYIASLTIEELEELITHQNEEVRELVAEFGDDDQRDKLINDISEYVRYRVAKYGSDKHRAILINDSNKYVRYASRRYLSYNRIEN